MGDLVLEGWCRATVGDVKEATKRTRVRHFNLSIPISEQMIKGKLRGKFTPEDIIHSMVDAVHAAREEGFWWLATTTVRAPAVNTPPWGPCFWG